MSTKSSQREDEGEADETGGHPGGSMAGVTAVPTVTDTWVTPMPHADATKLASLPKAVANAIDGKDHSDDPVFPDQGGQVLDVNAAAANKAASEE